MRRVGAWLSWSLCWGEILVPAKLAVRTAPGSVWSVPETMEKPRRWNGYVCPDCRFVFRVPGNYSGRGVVCPSCKRLLRVPTPADTTLPLMNTPQKSAADADGGEAEPARLKKRQRGRKSVGFDDQPWDQGAHATAPVAEDKRSMRWMRLGGIALFAAMVGVVIYTLKVTPKSAPVAVVQTPVVPAAKDPVEVALGAKQAEAIVLKDAEALARKFLAAKSEAELLPLVHNPEVTAGRMREFYGGKEIKPPGFSKFDSRSVIRLAQQSLLVLLETGEMEERGMVFKKSPQGLKIDWESWVGWSEMPWAKFVVEKPTTSSMFRVILNRVEYYNFGFTDESKWQSYQLVSPDEEHTLFGYTEKNSQLDVQVRPKGGAKTMAAALKLKFPPDATSASQVIIESVVMEGWVEENATP